jgi:hypothetical protein
MLPYHISRSQRPGVCVLDGGVIDIIDGKVDLLDDEDINIHHGEVKDIPNNDDEVIDTLDGAVIGIIDGEFIDTHRAPSTPPPTGERRWPRRCRPTLARTCRGQQ